MLRSFALKAEPLIFAGLSSLLSGRKARYARSILVQKYCKGYGAEIGAGVQPMLVPRGSRTVYIDAEPADFWRQDPRWQHENIRDPDIIDEGETLSTIADDSFDYLIAAHVLEHIEDPILAIKNWVRVVKPGGHILVAVPDMRFSEDERNREVTTVEHFKRDHAEGPHVSLAEHMQELGLVPEGTTGPALTGLHDQHKRMIHYHAFTLVSFVQLLASIEGVGFELVEASFNVNEDLAVLRRSSEQGQVEERLSQDA